MDHSEHHSGSYIDQEDASVTSVSVQSEWDYSLAGDQSVFYPGEFQPSFENLFPSSSPITFGLSCTPSSNIDPMPPIAADFSILATPSDGGTTSATTSVNGFYPSESQWVPTSVELSHACWPVNHPIPTIPVGVSAGPSAPASSTSVGSSAVYSTAAIPNNVLAAINTRFDGGDGEGGDSEGGSIAKRNISWYRSQAKSGLSIDYTIIKDALRYSRGDDLLSPFAELNRFKVDEYLQTSLDAFQLKHPLQAGLCESWLIYFV
jgi:hypothetical protein